MIEARDFARRFTRGAVALALVGGVLTVVATETASAATPTTDTLSLVAGATTLPTPSVCEASLATAQEPASTAPLCDSSSVATDNAGNVYVADTGRNEIDKIVNGVPVVIAGSRSAAPGNPFNEPHGIAVQSLANGSVNVFVANTNDDTIYEIVGGAGTPVRIAGTPGSAGPVKPGATAGSPIPFPKALALDPAGNLYVSTGSQILKITNPGGSNSTLSVLVNANGTAGPPVDGALAVNSPIAKVTSIAYNPSHQSLLLADWDVQPNVYVDSYIEEVSLTSSPTLSIVAGNGTTNGPTPGPAKNSALNLPSGVAVDKYGNIFVVESGGSRVDKIDANGTLTVLAGNGTPGLPVPGPAEQSPLYEPFGIAVDAARQTVYVTNASKAGQVLAITLVANPSAPTGLVATAGNGTIGLSFNIPADPGYTVITGYQFSSDGGQTWSATVAASSVVTGAGGSYRFTGLANGTSYSAAVRAVNDSGIGLAAVAAPATPFAPPAPTPPAPPAPPVAPVAPVAPTAPVVSSPNAPAKTTPAWFKDPLSAAQRRAEIAVPRNPASYRGAIKWTVATNKSRNGVIAVGVPSIRGRHLAPRQAATLTGDNLFRGNTATLTGAGAVQLRSLVASLKGDKAIVCEGYTDYAGNAKQLQTLSAQRALAVCKALKAGGAQVRFTSIGYGLYRPVIVGGAPANRAANRRIVVLVTG